MAASRALTLSSKTTHLRQTVKLPNAPLGLYKTRRICSGSSNCSKRCKSTSEEDDEVYVNGAAKELGVTRYYCNRNPRSLELLGMAEKPKGFETARRRVDYYHRLMFTPSSRHSTAYVNHNNGTKVVEASTTELCIARHLYKTSDVAAAYNVGRVMGVRCREAGLRRVMWEHKTDRNHERVKAFLKGIREQGLILNEPKVRNSLPQPGTLPK